MDLIERAETAEINKADERPELIQKVEQIDKDSLSPEDIEFLYHTIKDFYAENLSFVNQDLVKQIPDKIVIQNMDEFIKTQKQLDPTATEEKLGSSGGCYNQETDLIYLNPNGSLDSADFLCTILHETFHFVGIKSGNGFSGSNFSLPEKISDDEEEDAEMRYYITKGLTTLCEGSTKILDQQAKGSMGFDNSTFQSYVPEVYLMSRILRAFSDNNDKFDFHNFVRIYFNTPAETIQKTIEANLIPLGDREEFLKSSDHTFDTPSILYSIGVATEKLSEALDNDDEEAENAIYQDIDEAVQYYLDRKEGKDVQ